MEFVMMDAEDNYTLVSPQTAIGDLDHLQNSLVVREVQQCTKLPAGMKLPAPNKNLTLERFGRNSK
jgi:hypothetical protein